MSGPRRRLVAAVVSLLAAFPAAARAQHPGGRWITFETAHFRVHVRAETPELGRAAAGEAEAAYAELARELAPPRRRIELVVADNVDEANGFATVFPVPRVVVFAIPPAGDPQLGSHDRWLRLVITHELVHVFQFDRSAGWWRLAQRVLGRAPGLFPNTYVPTWLSEGLAVFYESRLTGAGRLEGSFHRGIVGANAAESGGLTIDAAGGTSPRWPGGIRPYAFGATFLDEVAARHGDSAVRGLTEQIARRALPYLQLNGVLRRSAGTTFTAAWRDWRDSLRGAAAQGAGGAEQPREVLDRLRGLVPPRVSPDGRSLLLAYNDGRDATRLVVLDLASGSRRELSRLNGFAGVAWLPTGDALVAQYDFTDPYTLRSDLTKVGAGGREERLTRGARLLAPDAAPDGAIVAVRAGLGGTELVLMDSAGIRTLAPGAADVAWAQPRFAPDGRTIAAVRVRGGWHDVVLLSREGEVRREVTNDVAMDLWPAFSPDGRWLVFSREVSGTPQIVGVPVDGDGAPQRFTAEPFAAYAPAVAGDTLYYLAAHGDGYRLVAKPLAGEPVALAEPAERPRAAPAPATPVRGEHGYRPFPALWPQYWLPTGVSATDASWIGAQSSGTDPLGRHFWFADALLGLGGARGSWIGDFAYSYARFSPAVLDASFSRGQIVLVDTAGATDCCVADDEWRAGVTLQRRSYRTALAVRLGGEFERAGFAPTPFERAGLVLSGSASHTIGAALGISVQDGWRAGFTLRQRWRRHVDREYTEASLRISGYRSFNAGGFARHVLAVRAAAGTIRGTDNVAFGVGGLSGGTYELAPGVTLGSGSRSFPVRGFPGSYAYGRHAAALSAEWRLPLALVGRGVGLLPGVLDRVSGVVFADGAAAWTETTCTTFGAGGGSPCVRTLLSAGAEIVTDVGVGWDFPVRLRFGTAFPFGYRTAALGYLAFGSWF